MVLHRGTAELLIRADEIDFLRRPQLEKRLNEPDSREGVNGKHIRYALIARKKANSRKSWLSISDISLTFENIYTHICKIEQYRALYPVYYDF